MRLWILFLCLFSPFAFSIELIINGKTYDIKEYKLENNGQRLIINHDSIPNNVPVRTETKYITKYETKYIDRPNKKCVPGIPLNVLKSASKAIGTFKPTGGSGLYKPGKGAMVDLKKRDAIRKSRSNFESSQRRISKNNSVNLERLRRNNTIKNPNNQYLKKNLKAYQERIRKLEAQSDQNGEDDYEENYQ